MKLSRKEEKQIKQFNQLAGYIKNNNESDFKKLLTGNSISDFQFDRTPKGEDSLLYEALSSKSPNIYMVEALIERGVVIDKKSQGLLAKEPLINNKEIKKAIENGREASTLKQLGQAFVHADQKECNRLIKVIEKENYNINRPVQIFDAEERPVFHAIAVSIDENKYGNKKFSKQKESIAHAITKIKDFNPHVLSMGQEGKGASPVTALVGQQGMLGKKSMELYNPSKFLHQQGVSNVKGMLFDKEKRTLNPVELQRIEEIDKNSPHYKNALDVVNKTMQEMANSQNFTVDEKQKEALTKAVAARFEWAEKAAKVHVTTEEMKQVLKGEQVQWQYFKSQDTDYNKDVIKSPKMLSVKEGHISIENIDTFVKLANVYVGNKQIEMENQRHQQEKVEKEKNKVELIQENKISEIRQNPEKKEEQKQNDSIIIEEKEQEVKIEPIKVSINQEISQNTKTQTTLEELKQELSQKKPNQQTLMDLINNASPEVLDSPISGRKETALNISIKKGFGEVTTTLLKRGSNPNVLDKKELKVLEKMAKKNEPLRQGIKDAQLQDAVEKGDIKQCEQLLKDGANPNQEVNGVSLLEHVASKPTFDHGLKVYTNAGEITQLIIKAGVDPKPLLMNSAKQVMTEKTSHIMNNLLDTGNRSSDGQKAKNHILLNTLDEKGRNVIESGVYHGNYHVTSYVPSFVSVDEVKNTKIETDRKGTELEGNTILHFAAQCENPQDTEKKIETIKKVMASEHLNLSVISLKNAKGQTAFDMTLEQKSPELAQAFLEQTRRKYRDIPFPSQMAQLCQYMAKDVGNEKQEVLVSAISKLLGKNLTEELNTKNLGASGRLLAEAIENQYPNEGNKLNLFLKALKSEMGENYPPEMDKSQQYLENSLKEMENKLHEKYPELKKEPVKETQVTMGSEIKIEEVQKEEKKDKPNEQVKIEPVNNQEPIRIFEKGDELKKPEEQKVTFSPKPIRIRNQKINSSEISQNTKEQKEANGNFLADIKNNQITIQQLWEKVEGNRYGQMPNFMTVLEGMGNDKSGMDSALRLLEVASSVSREDFKDLIGLAVVKYGEKALEEDILSNRRSGDLLVGVKEFNKSTFDVQAIRNTNPNIEEMKITQQKFFTPPTPTGQINNQVYSYEEGKQDIIEERFKIPNEPRKRTSNANTLETQIKIDEIVGGITQNNAFKEKFSNLDMNSEDKKQEVGDVGVDEVNIDFDTGKALETLNEIKDNVDKEGYKNVDEVNIDFDTGTALGMYNDISHNTDDGKDEQEHINFNVEEFKELDENAIKELHKEGGNLDREKISKDRLIKQMVSEDIERDKTFQTALKDIEKNAINIIKENNNEVEEKDIKNHPVFKKAMQEEKGKLKDVFEKESGEERRIILQGGLELLEKGAENIRKKDMPKTRLSDVVFTPQEPMGYEEGKEDIKDIKKVDLSNALKTLDKMQEEKEVEPFFTKENLPPQRKGATNIFDEISKDIQEQDAPSNKKENVSKQGIESLSNTMETQIQIGETLTVGELINYITNNKPVELDKVATELNTPPQYQNNEAVLNSPVSNHPSLELHLALKEMGNAYEIPNTIALDQVIGEAKNTKIKPNISEIKPLITEEGKKNVALSGNALKQHQHIEKSDKPKIPPPIPTVEGGKKIEVNKKTHESNQNRKPIGKPPFLKEAEKIGVNLKNHNVKEQKGNEPPSNKNLPKTEEKDKDKGQSRN